MIDFAKLLMEYSLLPFVLFILVFLARTESRAKGWGQTSIKGLVSGGLELILIEFFAYISFFVRFFQSTDVPPFVTWFAFVMLILLGFIFVTYIAAERTAKVTSVLGFLLTFYGSFFSWWLRVFLIMAVVSNLWLNCLIKILSFGGLSLFAMLSYLKFKSIVRLYFLKPNVLLRNCSRLLRLRKYIRAQDCAWKVINIVKNRQGTEYINAFFDAVTLLGMAYCYEGNPKSLSFAKGIAFTEQFLSHAETRGYEKSGIKNILASLYCIAGNKEKAKQLIRDAYANNQSIQSQKLNFIETNNCQMLTKFPYD